MRQYHQYVIRVDGTGRVTIRNRQHLRRFTPYHGVPTGGTFSARIPELPPSGELITDSPATANDSIQTGELQLPLSGSQMPLPLAQSPTSIRTPDYTPHQIHTPQQLNSDLLDNSGLDMPAPAEVPRAAVRDEPVVNRVPRALARLQPHNKAGGRKI